MKKKKLAIMVGHNPAKRGACRDGLTEFEYNLDVQGIMLAKTFEFGIEAKGFWRRGTDGFERSYEREIVEAYEKVRKWNPDAVLELHFNAFSDPSVKGCEAFWTDNPFARGLAECVLFTVLNDMDCNYRGVKHRYEGERGYFNISQLNAPTVLVEPFFVTNDEDWERFVVDPTGVERLAIAYLKGVREYFGEREGVEDKLMESRDVWQAPTKPGPRGKHAQKSFKYFTQNDSSPCERL